MTEPDFSATDPASLDTLEAVAAYLAAAFESGDADAMAAALAKVAQSEGLAHLAAAAGLPRAQLAEAMNAGEMSLDTTLAIMKVIDLHMPAQLPPGQRSGSAN
jgi:probable addiction module antidote protein